MVRVIGAVMIALGLAFVAVSMRLNYFAGLRLGETPEDGRIFGLVAMAVAAANGGLPFAIAAGVRRSQWGVTAAATVLLAIFLLYSLGSALGYAAGNRGGVVAEREGLTADYRAAVELEKDLRGRLKKVEGARPAGVLEAEMARQRQDRLWAQTKECTEATAVASRDFCKAYRALESELAAAATAANLRNDLKTASDRLTTLRAQGAGRESDPFAAAIGPLVNFSAQQVRSGWSMLFAVLVELGCAFVPFIGLSMVGVGHGGTPSPRLAQATGEPSAIPADKVRKGRTRVRKQVRRGHSQRRLPGPPMLQLPPLRKAEFGEDGQLRIEDEERG